MKTRILDDAKQARVDEVRALLMAFAAQHWPGAPELAGYLEKLWAQIGRKRNFVITGGTKEVWASSVVYVIARLNFLFDRTNPNHLSHDTICGFFGTKKGTVSARAKEIETACRIRVGQEGLCSPDITDDFTYVQLFNGIVLSRRMAKEMGFIAQPNQPPATSDPAPGADSSSHQV